MRLPAQSCGLLTEVRLSLENSVVSCRRTNISYFKINSSVFIKVMFSYFKFLLDSE